MNADKMKGWVPVLMLVASILMTGATAQYQITENKSDIKELQKDKETQIRIEERQKRMKEDLQEIKDILRGLAR